MHRCPDIRASGRSSAARRGVQAVARQSLRERVESVTLDAYGVDEESTAFLTVFGDAVALPCPAKILDIDVEVLAFDIAGDERGGLVARCQHVEGCPGVVSLADIRFGLDTVAAWLRAAFRTWLGLRACPGLVRLGAWRLGADKGMRTMTKGSPTESFRQHGDRMSWGFMQIATNLLA